MESLRSRPSQGPRKEKPAKILKPGSTPRDRSKNKIDDKIKKRMSTRYAEISSPTQLTGLPPMPNMMGMVPAGQNFKDDVALERDEDVRDRTGSKDDVKAITDDRKLLSSENFDPAACEWEIHISFYLFVPINLVLKLKLANSTEAELKSLQSSLRNAIDDTASDLQRSVFKKYVFNIPRKKQPNHTTAMRNSYSSLKKFLSWKMRCSSSKTYSLNTNLCLRPYIFPIRHQYPRPCFPLINVHLSLISASSILTKCRPYTHPLKVHPSLYQPHREGMS